MSDEGKLALATEAQLPLYLLTREDKGRGKSSPTMYYYVFRQPKADWTLSAEGVSNIGSRTEALQAYLEQQKEHVNLQMRRLRLPEALSDETLTPLLRKQLIKDKELTEKELTIIQSVKE